MSTDIKVSVIVPAYNCEEYIDELFDCLLNQTLDCIEIIIVDNASTDSTAQRVAEYAVKYDNVLLMSETSQGAGIARNTGLKNASGKYVAFLDADDLYDSQMLEKLYNKMEAADADMGVCSVLKIDYSLDKKSRLSSFSKEEDIIEDKPYSYRDFKNVFTAFEVSPQNKMFKTSFVRDNALAFSKTKSSNDLFFTEAARLSAERIVLIPEDLVTIRRNYNTSSLSSTRKKSSEDIVIVLKELYAFLEKRGLAGELKNNYLRFCCKHIKYGAQQGKNEVFCEAVKAWLREEPWCTLSKQEFYKTLNFCKLHNELSKSRIIQDIEATDDKNKKNVLQSKLSARENQEYALLQFIDLFFDGDTALIDECEAEQIKAEYISTYNKSNDLKAKNSSLKADNKELKSKNKELKASYREKRDSFNELRQSNKELKQSHRELKNKHKELKAENKELKSEIKSLKADKKRLKDSNKKIRSSASYKIGRIITFIPRKIKKILSK